MTTRIKADRKLRPKKDIVRLNGAKLKELYMFVVERDEGLCVKCGAPGVDIHHKVFRSQGGSDTADNMELLCRRCHDIVHGKVIDQSNMEI